MMKRYSYISLSGAPLLLVSEMSSPPFFSPVGRIIALLLRFSTLGKTASHGGKRRKKFRREFGIPSLMWLCGTFGFPGIGISSGTKSQPLGKCAAKLGASPLKQSLPRATVRSTTMNFVRRKGSSWETYWIETTTETLLLNIPTE